MSIYDGEIFDYSVFEIAPRQDGNDSEFEDLYIQDKDGAYILYYVAEDSGELQKVARFRRLWDPDEREQEIKNINLSDLVVFKKYIPSIETDCYGDFVIVGPRYPDKKWYWNPQIERLDMVNW